MAQKSITIFDGTRSITLAGYDYVVPALQNLLTVLQDVADESLDLDELSDVTQKFTGVVSKAHQIGKSVVIEPATDDAAGVAPEIEEQPDYDIGRRQSRENARLSHLLRTISKIPPQTSATVDAAEKALDAAEENEIRRNISAVLGDDTVKKSTPGTDHENAVKGNRKSNELDRLFQKTEAHLDSPSSRKLREAYDRFRAAIAINRAETANPSHNSVLFSKHSDLSYSFREDLKQVTNDKDDTRLPPRLRVIAELSDQQNEFKDFASFAKTFEAKTLASVIEAAAAYLLYVQGVGIANRVDIVKLVSGHLGPEVFDMDETLEMLGQLVAQGRLSRTDKGTYEVPDSTSFHPRSA